MIPGSSKDHPSFVRSFGYAIEGFITAVRTERNINVMLLVGALTVIAGLVIGLDLASWCIIAICCGLVIHAELCDIPLSRPLSILPRARCILWQNAPRISPRLRCMCCRLPLPLWAFSCSLTPYT